MFVDVNEAERNTSQVESTHHLPSQQHGEYVLCDESAVEALALLYEVFLLEEFLEREFFSVQNSLDRRLLREPRDAPERALNHYKVLLYSEQSTQTLQSRPMMMKETPHQQSKDEDEPKRERERTREERAREDERAYDEPRRRAKRGEKDSGAGGLRRAEEEKKGSGGRRGIRFFSWRLLPRTVRESGREEGGCQLGFCEISGC